MHWETMSAPQTVLTFKNPAQNGKSHHFVSFKVRQLPFKPRIGHIDGQLSPNFSEDRVSYGGETRDYEIHDNRNSQSQA